MSARVRRFLIGMVVAAALLGPGSGTVAGQTLLEAPYPIEYVQRSPSSPAEGWLMVAGLGRAPELGSPNAGSVRPPVEALEWVTVLGSEGWTHAYLASAERRCEFLCGPTDGEECHWVGLFATPTALPPIGEFLAILPGRLDLTAFRSFGTDSEPAGAEAWAPGPQAFLAVDSAARPLLWTRSPEWAPRYRVDAWDGTTGQLELTIVQPDGSSDTMALVDCAPTGAEWLRVVDCQGMSLLASGGRLLLLSWPDYNSAKVDVLARFDFGGSRHYLIRYGSKAQDLVGLVSGEPAGWRARFRERDWAQIC